MTESHYLKLHQCSRLLCEYEKHLKTRCFFLCQKGAVMLTMIVLLVLLYALNGSFAVPTVCFVLSWIGIGFGAFDLILKLFLKAYEKHLD